MDPILGTIFYFGFNFIPMGFAQCAGQILQISINSALFSLLGTTFGGNGSTTFALPDLRGRVVVGSGNTYTHGQAAGSATTTQVPSHIHPATLSNASATIKANASAGTLAGPAGRTNVLGAATSGVIYNNIDPNINLNVGGGAVTGTVSVLASGAASVSLMQPYLVLNACITTMGIYPTRE